jgi:hypothetical protein
MARQGAIVTPTELVRSALRAPLLGKRNMQLVSYIDSSNVLLFLLIDSAITAFRITRRVVHE